MGAAAAQKRSWDGGEEEDGGGDERGGCWWCESRGGGPSHLLRVCGACRTRESHANAAPSCRIPINAKRTSSQTFEFKRVATKWNNNRVVFNLRSICLTFKYERKGSLKWTRSALITAPRSWGLWLHMHASLLAWGWSCQSLPPLLQVNTVVLMLKTSCSGSTNRCLCI